MLTLQGPKTSLKQNNYFYRQSLPKYIWNLLGFTENIDLK